MADLFHKQAKNYVETRPTYPPDLFQFIASKTPRRHLVWDVGAGSGQAAVSLAEMYEKVVATDTSQQQLDHAPKLPNVRYQCTPPTMSLEDLARDVAPRGSVDLVTVAQALHWFDLPKFYQQVDLVLRRPHGVLAAWCYTEPRVDESVDPVFWRLYTESAPFWAPERRIVDEEYKGIEFPFDPVEGADHTGPFEFETGRWMDLEAYLTYIRSWSAYQTARERGVELLRKEVVDAFKGAWEKVGEARKLVRWPIHLRIGRVRV